MDRREDSFTVRGYREGDETKINEMFNEVFNQNRSLTHWYWKYRDNPYGSHRISLAVSPEGLLAAHYGGYPVRLYFRPRRSSSMQEVSTYHLGDKMTRKQFRSVGFGKTSLLAKTFSHFKKTYAKGIPFGYGFGTHHSLRFGLIFLNYADIEPVPYRTLDRRKWEKLKYSPLRRFVRPLRVEEVTDLGDEWTDFFNRAAPFYEYLAKRDTVYLRWRYLARPDRRYLFLLVREKGVPAGWAVFHRENDRLLWGDALFVPDCRDAVASILCHLRGHPLAEGAEIIECWFPPRPEWWDRTLLELGFEMEREPNNLHFTGPIFNDEKAPEILKKYLYYTWGDSDLF